MSAIDQATEPFRFYSRLHLRELTGLRARNLKELVQLLKEVPGSVIYHHTHHFLQQHQYLVPEPPNDFAYWVDEMLLEKKLAEKLASINTCEFGSIRTLRERLISVIETYLEKSPGPPREAREGEELHLIKSVSFVFPTTYEVRTLEEFMAALGKVTIDSIYFHMFEARLRLEKGTNDFSLWLETSLGETELARKIIRLDPYTYTMEGLRAKILELCEKHRGQKSKPASAGSEGA